MKAEALRFFFWAGLLALAGCTSNPARAPSSFPLPHLDAAFASKAVQLSLHCVDTETPHWDEGQGHKPHAEKLRHPAFYGCFDWHSAVHGHWAMLRAADEVDGLPEKGQIIAALSRHLTAKNLRGELASISKVESSETPYGWGWGLRLGEELRTSKIPEAAHWQAAYAPFEEKLLKEMRGYLAGLSQPNRTGMHDNTAYAMVHAWDFSRTSGNEEFQSYLDQVARKLFFADHDCPLASEPGATDFISPCFVEADLMRRVLSKDEFALWYSHFLPDVKPEQLKPVVPSNPQDYFEVHLVGLMYEKSSAMSGVASELDEADPRRAVLLEATQAQIAAASALMFNSGYGGTHWLASFAIYYYSAVGL